MRAETERWVVDASVVVEYLVDLRLAPQANRFVRDAIARGGELWAPDLVYPEVASALRRLVHRGDLSVDEGARAIGWLAELPVLVTGTVALMAEVWRMRVSLTAYDACYAALALRLDASLVTADAGLADAVVREGGRGLSLAALPV